VRRKIPEVCPRHRPARAQARMPVWGGGPIHGCVARVLSALYSEDRHSEVVEREGSVQEGEHDGYHVYRYVLQMEGVRQSPFQVGGPHGCRCEPGAQAFRSGVGLPPVMTFAAAERWIERGGSSPYVAFLFFPFLLLCRWREQAGNRPPPQSAPCSCGIARYRYRREGITDSWFILAPSKHSLPMEGRASGRRRWWWGAEAGGSSAYVVRRPPSRPAPPSPPSHCPTSVCHVLTCPDFIQECERRVAGI